MLGLEFLFSVLGSGGLGFSLLSSTSTHSPQGGSRLGAIRRIQFAYLKRRLVRCSRLFEKVPNR